MRPTQRKKLVIHLILNDLVNNKLVTGLQAMGIDASDYYLYLSNAVFELMGFGKEAHTVELYEFYSTLSLKALAIDLKGNACKALAPLAKEIYKELKKKHKSSSDTGKAR